MIWAWVGAFNLALLVYQDFKNNMRVDDRRNYLMLGLTMSLLAYTPYPYWFVFVVVVVGLALRYFMKRFKVLGEADVTTLWWIYYGMALLGLYRLVFFFGLLVGLTVVYAGIGRLIARKRVKYAYYPLIFISFVITGLAFGHFEQVIL